MTIRFVGPLAGTRFPADAAGAATITTGLSVLRPILWLTVSTGTAIGVNCRACSGTFVFSGAGTSPVRGRLGTGDRRREENQGQAEPDRQVDRKNRRRLVAGCIVNSGESHLGSPIRLFLRRIATPPGAYQAPPPLQVFGTLCRCIYVTERSKRGVCRNARRNAGFNVQ